MRERYLLALGCVALIAACKNEKAAEASAPASSASAVANTAPAGLLAVGAAAPAIEATAQTGQAVSLASLRGKPVVVYFYPKDDTPGCTIEAKSFRDTWVDLKKTDVVVLGVSSDDNDSHRAFTTKYELPFLLLPDKDHKIANAFGVPLRMGYAKRVTFLIDRSGQIAKVWPDVDPEKHADDVMTSIKAPPG